MTKDDSPKSAAIGSRVKPAGPGTRYTRDTQAKTGMDPELHLAKHGAMPARKGRQK